MSALKVIREQRMIGATPSYGFVIMLGDRKVWSGRDFVSLFSREDAIKVGMKAVERAMSVRDKVS